MWFYTYHTNEINAMNELSETEASLLSLVSLKHFGGAAGPSGGVTINQEAASYALQNGDKIADRHHGVIFLALLFGESAFGAFVSQFFDSRLHLRIGAQPEQGLSAFPVKALTHGG
jgi:hypothetical protein